MQVVLGELGECVAGSAVLERYPGVSCGEDYFKEPAFIQCDLESVGCGFMRLRARLWQAGLICAGRKLLCRRYRRW